MCYISFRIYYEQVLVGKIINMLLVDKGYNNLRGSPSELALEYDLAGQEN